VNKPTVRYIRWIPGPAWIGGITIPPVGIFIEAQYKTDRGLLNHELWHWWQYQCRGFWRFVWDYWTLFVRYGYRNHPMEQEADRHRAGNIYGMKTPS